MRTFSYKSFSYTLSNDRFGRFISTIHNSKGEPISSTTQHRMGETFTHVSSYCEDYINTRVAA